MCTLVDQVARSLTEEVGLLVRLLEVKKAVA